MSNRELRAEAASLVRRFRDCEITNDQFERSFDWLRCRTNDRAVKAIATAVWTTYSDHREHKLNDGHELTAEGRLLFDRCAAFLESDLPYLWERDDFVGIALVSDAIRFLSKAVWRLIGRAAERVGLRPGPDSKQEWSVWPFQNDPPRPG